MATSAQVTVGCNDSVIDVQLPAAASLENRPSFSHDCCIYRVPKALRYKKENMYVPGPISTYPMPGSSSNGVYIGPLHHGPSDMGNVYKIMFLAGFLRRIEESKEEFLQAIRMNEDRLRRSYSETISFSSGEFVEMILLDSVFIIELLLSYASRELTSNIVRLDFGNFSVTMPISNICRYLCLLENQVPFFILEVVFEKSGIGRQNGVTMLKLALSFFKDMNSNFRSVQLPDGVRVRHFVDLLRLMLQPCSRQPKKRRYFKGTTIGPLSATGLQEVGIKLQKAEPSLLDIRYRKRVVEIPALRVDSLTEIMLRNIMAFEQCSGGPCFVTDYIVFLSHLIKAPADAELLSRMEIIDFNQYFEEDDACLLFRDLSKGISYDLSSSYLCDVIRNLNRHSREKMKWKRTLRQGLLILLNLAVIQTICSIIQVHQGYKR